MSKVLFSFLFKKQPVVRLGACGLFLFLFLSLSPAVLAGTAFPVTEEGQTGLFVPFPASGELENAFSFDMNKELAQPVLRILYTASTWGETQPCPTCRTAYGGLDRRSAYFAKRRNGKSPVFVIAGPDEFLADAPKYTRQTKAGTEGADAGTNGMQENAVPPSLDAPVSLAAHMLLDVNAGYMSPRAAAWMEKNAGATPPGFHVVHEAPVCVLSPTPAGTVGVVFFPRGRGKSGHPTEEQIQKVLSAGSSLRAKSVLLIGVSPWGYDAEKTFLRQGEGTFHILLGGGDGMPFAQAIAKECPSILWSRPDSMGRAITEINLMELPPSAASGNRAQWLEGVSFKARLIFLDDSYPSDPQMQQILP